MNGTGPETVVLDATKSAEVSTSLQILSPSRLTLLLFKITCLVTTSCLLSPWKLVTFTALLPWNHLRR